MILETKSLYYAFWLYNCIRTVDLSDAVSWRITFAYSYTVFICLLVFYFNPHFISLFKDLDFQRPSWRDFSVAKSSITDQSLFVLTRDQEIFYLNSCYDTRDVRLAIKSIRFSPSGNNEYLSVECFFRQLIVQKSLISLIRCGFCPIWYNLAPVSVWEACIHRIAAWKVLATQTTLRHCGQTGNYRAKLNKTRNTYDWMRLIERGHVHVSTSVY